MKTDNNCADSFLDSSDHLPTEIHRLREDNADLRASALMWKALYEAAIAEASDNIVGTLARHQGRAKKSPSSVAHVIS